MKKLFQSWIEEAVLHTQSVGKREWGVHYRGLPLVPQFYQNMYLVK